MAELQRIQAVQENSEESQEVQQVRGFGSNQERQKQMRLNLIRVQANSFEQQGLRAGVLEKGLTAFRTAFHNGETESMIFTIIDFELHSSKKRLWVINLETGVLIHNEKVTHGANSDRNADGFVDSASALSNRDESHQSNIGLLKTAETYHSSKFNGTSLRMDGLEDGFNDNARDRAIVMHPAAYADRSDGQALGRSWGCPALDPDVSGEVIETIKNGTLIFQYYPDEKWLETSGYLK